MKKLPKTNSALLERLRSQPNDQDAWNEFVQTYAPTLFQWARENRLSPSDSEELTQAILVRVFAMMSNFHYDPDRSFRGLLRRMTLRAMIDTARQRKRIYHGEGRSVPLEILQSLPARKNLLDRMEKAFDLAEYEQACRKVMDRVRPEMWEAFRLTLPPLLGGEELENGEIALRLGLNKVQVEQAKNRVRNMLTMELNPKTKTPFLPGDSPL